MNEADYRISAEVEVEVPFQDCDPLGVTWHGNYFRYLETARSALLNRVGYNYAHMTATGFAWPIVDTRLKYLRPTKFSEHIAVSATLVEFLNRMKIEYVVKNCVTGEPVTRGYTIQVAVNMANGEMCFCSPDEFVEKVVACASAG